MMITRLCTGMKSFIYVSFSAALLSFAPITAAITLTLPAAEQKALKHDNQIKSLQLKAQAMQEESVADGSWMDPEIAFGSMELPGNDPNPAAQGMLELKVSQMLPRGQTAQLKQSIKLQQSQLLLNSLKNRQLTTLREVRLAWLDGWYQQQAIALLKDKRRLLESLTTATRSKYRHGKNNQQDVLRAELEIISLDEKIIATETASQQSLARLKRWTQQNNIKAVSQTLPELTAGPAETQQLEKHPIIHAATTQVTLADQGILLAKESFSPEIGVEFKYSHMQNEMSAGMQSDRNQYSVMFMMDLPFFTENRQDRQLAAASYRREAFIANRQDALAMLKGDLDREYSQYTGLSAQLTLYKKTLIPQLDKQINSLLQSYGNDSGTFSDVIQAYTLQLQRCLDQLRLKAEQLKSAARVRYFNAADDLSISTASWEV